MLNVFGPLITGALLVLQFYFYSIGDGGAYSIALIAITAAAFGSSLTSAAWSVASR